jgi:hypothetical protein
MRYGEQGGGMSKRGVVREKMVRKKLGKRIKLI